MSQFFAIALYLCVSVALLVLWPLFRHSTLPKRHKWLIGIVSFLFFVPGGLLLYGFIGAPQLANL